MPRPASRKKSIAFGPYPTIADGIPDAHVVRDMDIFKAVVSAARTIRSEHEVDRKVDVPLSFRSDSADARKLIQERLGAIRFLTNTTAPKVEVIGGPREPGTTTSVVPTALGPIEVLVGLKGLVEKDKELVRIDREIKKIDKDLASIEKKMSSKGFMDRAPKEVIEETLALKQQLQDARVRLEESKKLADEL